MQISDDLERNQMLKLILQLLSNMERDLKALERIAKSLEEKEQTV